MAEDRNAVVFTEVEPTENKLYPILFDEEEDMTKGLLYPCLE